MNCTEYPEFFSDLYDGTLEGDPRRRIEAHLSACAPCRAEYEVFRESLRQLGTTATLEASDRIVEAVTTTLRIAKVDVREVPSKRLKTARGPSSPWIPLGIAAGISVIFATGFLISSSVVRRELDGLRDEISRLRATPTPTMAPRPETDGVWTDGHRMSVDAFLAEAFEKEGLVRQGKAWLPREIKGHLDRGEAFIDGRWVDVRGEVDRIVAEKMAAAPKPPAPESEEDLLARRGLVKRGDWILPRVWAEAMDEGRVLTPDGRWQTVDGLSETVLVRHGFVRHNGRWMSEDQRDRTLAQQQVRCPERYTVEPPVARLLHGLEIGPPVSYRNLTIYPVLAPEGRTTELLPLADALAARSCEILDTSGILTVQVRNSSPSDVLILGGTLLPGGRCERSVAGDVLVPAGAAVPVRVYDVEPTRYRTSGSFTEGAGRFMLVPSTRRLVSTDGGQGAIWYGIAAQVAPLKKGASALDVHQAHAASIAEYRDAFATLRSSFPTAIGMAVAYDGRLDHATLFASQDLFGSFFDMHLSSCALEAVLRQDSGPGTDLPASVAAVKHFLESVFGCVAEPLEEGAGLTIRTSTGRTLGRALVRHQTALHVELFVESRSTPPRPVIEISPAKVQAILAEYEKRFEAAPAPQRPGILRELGALPQQRVTALLVRHLEDADEPVQVAAAEALARRGDPSCVKPLIKAFRDSRRQLGLMPALAQALARLGQEEAVPPFLEVLEGRDVTAASIVASHIPTLLLQQRNESVLERGVGRMIDTLERLHDRINATPLAQVGMEMGCHGTLAAALRSTLGVNFSEAVDFRRWWNDSANRERFLRDRKS